MVNVIGVRFRQAGKIYFFDPTGFTLNQGDNVIVETARGIEFGTVVLEKRQVEEDKVIQPYQTLYMSDVHFLHDKERIRQNNPEAFYIAYTLRYENSLNIRTILLICPHQI